MMLCEKTVQNRQQLSEGPNAHQNVTDTEFPLFYDFAH